MGKAKSAADTYRARKTHQGFVRLEVNVRKEDASLLRGVASALSDPFRQAEARKLLQRCFLETPTSSLKALLASAPLEGIQLDRTADPGRDIDL